MTNDRRLMSIRRAASPPRCSRFPSTNTIRPPSPLTRASPRAPEQRAADADHRGAFLDRDLEVAAHPHRQLVERHAGNARCAAPAARPAARYAARTRRRVRGQRPHRHEPAQARAAARRGAGAPPASRAPRSGATPCLARLAADVHLDQHPQGRRPASPARAVERHGQLGRVHRLHPVEERRRAAAPCSTAGGRSGATSGRGATTRRSSPPPPAPGSRPGRSARRPPRPTAGPPAPSWMPRSGALLRPAAPSARRPRRSAREGRPGGRRRRTRSRVSSRRRAGKRLKIGWKASIRQAFADPCGAPDAQNGVPVA